MGDITVLIAKSISDFNFIFLIQNIIDPVNFPK